MSLKCVLTSTSVFCNKSHWARLLRTGISPFLNTVHAQYSNFYLIEFNYLCGENIRLSLLVEEIRAERLIAETDRYFRQFFLDACLSQSELHLPVEGIFIPFPQNTIQYGLYQPNRIESLYEINNSDIRLSLSESLLEAFKDEENIDDEIILTLAIYLHMIFIKVILKNDYGSIEGILNFYNGLRREEEFLLKDDYMIPKFENNKDILLEIADTMLYSSLADSPPGWINKWTTVCENELQSGPAWNAIADLINIHLGINEEIQLVLLFFIKQILANGSENFRDYHRLCKFR